MPLRHELIYPIKTRMVKIVARFGPIAQGHRLQCCQRVLEIVALDLLGGVAEKAAAGGGGVTEQIRSFFRKTRLLI